MTLRLLSHLRRCLMLALACLSLLIFGTQASAETISVKSAVVRLQDDAYILDAEFDFSLTQPLEEALERGTPLYFVLETEITRLRNFWIDEKLNSPQFIRRLTYAALTDAYRVDTGSSLSAPLNYHSLDEALRKIRTIRGRTLIEKGSLIAGERYEISLRLKLDTARLPKPLQVNTLVSRDWSLVSDWYRILLTP